MKYTDSRQISRLTLLLLPLVLVGAVATQATELTITIPDSGRPVAVAMQKLEAIYNLPINYEDMPYLSQSDTVTGPVGQLMPKHWGPITITYTIPSADATLAARKILAQEAINATLRSYDATRGNGEWFSFRETDQGFDVLASRFVTASGEAKPLPSLMNTRITIARGERTLKQFIDEVSTALSLASGRKIVTGTLPTPLFGQYHTTIGADGELAESVLQKLFKETPVGYFSDKQPTSATKDIPTTLSWRLYCVPPDSTLECAINVSIVAPENHATVGMGQTLPPIEK